MPEEGIRVQMIEALCCAQVLLVEISSGGERFVSLNIGVKAIAERDNQVVFVVQGCVQSQGAAF